MAKERCLTIPHGYRGKKLETKTWRIITSFEYVDRELQLYSHPHNATSKREHIGIKQKFFVRIFQSTQVPCYGFYYDKYYNSYLELYLSFDETRLKQIYATHYPMQDYSITISPGSPYITSSFTYEQECIIVVPTKEEVVRLGVPLAKNKKPIIDHYEYY